MRNKNRSHRRLTRTKNNLRYPRYAQLHFMEIPDCLPTFFANGHSVCCAKDTFLSGIIYR